LVSYRTIRTQNTASENHFFVYVCSPSERERYLKIYAVVSFKAVVLAEDHTVLGHCKIPLNLVRSIFLGLALNLATACLLFITMFIKVVMK